MQNSEIFIGMFFSIGLAFSAMALRARGQMRVERGLARPAAGNSVTELDRKIAELTALRDQLRQSIVVPPSTPIV